ncbi:apical junction molecule-like [Procambarus clarkii]|uniref:apical junction molecule-like n=1 Tax=Procambarus clarkii TaxID=6728 RepID=UPI003743DA75
MDRVQEFITKEDPLILESCTKEQLKQIAEHYEIELVSTKVVNMRQELGNKVRSRREDVGAVGLDVSAKESGEQDNEEVSSNSSRRSGSLEYELERLKLEAQIKREERQFQLKKLKLEKVRLESEQKTCVELEKEKTKQMEIEANKFVAAQRREREVHSESTPMPAAYDHKAREKEVPQFCPEESESFFEHFEKVATLKQWPEEDWAQLVQIRLTGAAREAYTQLSLDDCKNYWTVKNSVLRSFLLTPEAYRKRFREMVKTQRSTYAETARDLERRLQRWMGSEKVESFEDLKQLMLMEKFLEMVTPDTRFKVQEAGIKTLLEAADKADVITEAYRSLQEYEEKGHAKLQGSKRRYTWNSRDGRGYTGKPIARQSQGYVEFSPTGGDTFEGQASAPSGQGENTSRYRGTGQWRRGESYYNGQRCSRGRGFSSQVICYTCNKPGHLNRECRQGRRVVSLTVSKYRSPYINLEEELPQEKMSITKGYNPFISKGMVSIGGQHDQQVTILPDTGANQSLILKSLIPEYRSCINGQIIKVRGINSEMHIPVCTVKLTSDYFTDEVMLGVCSDIPVPGVHVILGNDLCGSSVLPEVLRSDVPNEHQNNVRQYSGGSLRR